MRKTWTIEQRVRGQNQRAKQAGARHDLTLEQWLETLEFFDHKCAYCGENDYQFIDHYLPVAQAGTTVSNCVPACARCNAFKDAKNHKLTLYQNDRVLTFLKLKGVKIAFHIHGYIAVKKEFVTLVCKGCGDTLVLPGLAFDEAQDYIDEFLSNVGYAYIP